MIMDDSNTSLRPATPDELAESISFALRYDGRKRVNHADEMMARITADRLVRHLRSSGFVIMCGPPAASPRVGSAPRPASTASDQDAHRKDQRPAERDL
jgi:hypothetical protein